MRGEVKDDSRSVRTTSSGWSDDSATWTRRFYDCRGQVRLTFTYELIRALGADVMRERYGMEFEDSVMSLRRETGRSNFGDAQPSRNGRA